MGSADEVLENRIGLSFDVVNSASAAERCRILCGPLAMAV